MKIEKFVLGALQTNSYLILNEETKEVVIVDPAVCPDYVLSHVKSNGYIPKGIQHGAAALRSVSAPVSAAAGTPHSSRNPIHFFIRFIPCLRRYRRR